MLQGIVALIKPLWKNARLQKIFKWLYICILEKFLKASDHKTDICFKSHLFSLSSQYQNQSKKHQGFFSQYYL